MTQVNGYQANLPIDPPFIVANLPTTVFDTKFKNAGQKPQYEPEQVLQEIKIIDPNKRRSVRSLAGALGISKSSIGSMKKEKKLRVYTMSLKPKLNDDHYLNHLYHCISNKIDRNTINGVTGLKYNTFYNEVHVDEKWFYLVVQDGGRYYLVTADEVPPPTISVQHKRHITKVMFLCALLARPRYNNTTRQWFDGLLIGIYQVGEFDMYSLGSRYNARGDLKWTNFTLDRDEYQQMMVKFILPADIKRKMPITTNNNIIVQQDGATAHLPVDDPVFLAKVEAGAVWKQKCCKTLHSTSSIS
jgi:hypothetical protein